MQKYRVVFEDIIDRSRLQQVNTTFVFNQREVIVTQSGNRKTYPVTRVREVSRNYRVYHVYSPDGKSASFTIKLTEKTQVIEYSYASPQDQEDPMGFTYTIVEYRGVRAQ